MRKITIILTLLIIILLISSLWNRIVVIIDAGEAGVHFNRFTGTEIDKTYREGIYFYPPWDSMTIYNIRVQERNDNFKVLSNQGLLIKIRISVRYRPMINKLSILHQDIGPNYLKSVIIPETESIIRKYFAKFNDEEIYTSKGSILEKISLDIKKRLLDKYIILDDLIIRNIEFPKRVKAAIKAKINEYHKYKEYDYKIEREKSEAKRKVIEAKGLSRYKDIISKNITDKYLYWEGIQATMRLADSINPKTIIIGSSNKDTSIILDTKKNNYNQLDFNKTNK